MRNVSRFSVMFIASVLLLLSQPHTAESAEQKEIRVKEVFKNYDADRQALDVKDVEGRFYLPALRKALFLSRRKGLWIMETARLRTRGGK